MLSLVWWINKKDVVWNVPLLYLEISNDIKSCVYVDIYNLFIYPVSIKRVIFYTLSNELQQRFYNKQFARNPFGNIFGMFQWFNVPTTEWCDKQTMRIICHRKDNYRNWNLPHVAIVKRLKGISENSYFVEQICIAWLFSLSLDKKACVWHTWLWKCHHYGWGLETSQESRLYLCIFDLF